MTVVIDGSLGITAPAATISGALSAATETFTATPAVTTAQSMVKLNTAGGNGSTNTAIRYFTNNTNGVNGCVIQGSDITYTPSSVNGDSFTINTSGVYAISYSDNFSGQNWVGISLNASGSQLTSNVSLISPANILNMAYTSGASVPTAVADTVQLPAGSVVRAHSVAASGVGANVAFFTITRVA